MSNTTINTTVNKLQELAKEWAAQFDGEAPMAIHFNVNSEALLEVNGIPFCPISEVDVNGSSFDVEFFYIYTAAGNFYEIYLHCPYEGSCEIGYIDLVTPVYCAESIQEMAE